MNKEVETKGSKKKSIIKIIILLLMTLSISSSAFAIFELFNLDSIENAIRYIVIAILILLDLVIILKGLTIFKKRPKKKSSKRIGFMLFMVIYSIICAIVGTVIFYLLSQLQNINTGYVTYSSSLVTMRATNIKNIKDVKGFKIGIWNNQESPDGYIIPQEIIKKYKLNDNNEIVNYDDYSSMLTDLYVNDIGAMILPSSYADMFSSIAGYENITKDTNVIVSQEKEMKKADVSEVETASNGKDITEPFTILLMGIDSTAEVLQKNAIANGDTLIVITFNPKTLNATILSIPRDSYVPIACWANKAKNKITHAAGYGTDCMINTIEQYLGINLDYYAKINFKGLVKLVNAVGGVEINVDRRLCTNSSNRDGEICINPGYQTLDGEQALVYARNRYDLPNGDFGRNQHQQEIVMALVNKFKNITDATKFMEVLNTISNSLDTNLTKKQMLSFYNIGKDIVKKSLSSDKADLINIQQLYLAGNSQNIYDERMRMVLYNYIPNENSRKDIVNAMKENLELIKPKAIKSFEFSINSPYEKEIIGKGPYKTSSLYKLLPDFTGDDMATARASANKLGISVTFEGDSGYVIAQNYPAKKRVDLMNGPLKLTLSGSKKPDDNSNEKDNNEKDEEKPNDNDKDEEKPNDNDKDEEKPNDKNEEKPSDKDEKPTTNDKEEENNKTDNEEKPFVRPEQPDE